MKKGQAAMEFLMTYGWAILAAVIVIAVLAYFGVFSPETYLPNNTATPEIKEFCLTIDPTYLLLCRGGLINNTILVQVKQDTLNITIEKNNCTISGENDALDIIYCKQQSNLTKYKISTAQYLP